MNDDFVRVVDWLAPEGAKVTADQIVVVLETTKATFDVPAGSEGYLFPLVPSGAEASVGSPLAVLSQHPVRPDLTSVTQTKSVASQTSEQTITVKARSIMESHGLRAAQFPELAVIRSSDVEKYLARQGNPPSDSKSRVFRGEVLNPTVDWEKKVQDVEDLEMRILLDSLRRRMKARFDRHVPLGTLLHDRWQLAKDHAFGEGTSVYDECLILGEVIVGKHCWIGPFTILDGQGKLTIGDYVDIGAGAHLYTHNTIERALTGHKVPLYRRETTIGNCCFIAPQAVIGPGTTIGNHCFVAAGSYVEGVFPDYSYIAGNPARRAGEVEICNNRARIRPAAMSEENSHRSATGSDRTT